MYDQQPRNPGFFIPPMEYAPYQPYRGVDAQTVYAALQGLMYAIGRNSNTLSGYMRPIIHAMKKAIDTDINSYKMTSAAYYSNTILTAKAFKKYGV